jgi:hypothetical protein
MSKDAIFKGINSMILEQKMFVKERKENGKNI